MTTRGKPIKRRRSVSAKTKKEDPRAAAARINGRKGGRPRRWSHEALAIVVSCVRNYARRGGTRQDLAEELMRFAQAVEDRALRLAGTPPTPEELAALAQPKTIRIITVMRVVGGRSKRGIEKAANEIAEQVLGRYSCKFLEGWEYAIVVPYRSEAELEQILTVSIPGLARQVAVKRHCDIDYMAFDAAQPRRRWTERL
jgi:hypothetical protein